MSYKSKVLQVAAAAALSRPTLAGQDFVLEKVGEGIWAAIVNDDGKAGGNAGFVIGDDGIAVIDTFQDPRPAAELLREIRKISKLPIRFVINTHYHLDHVNGNDVFAAEGATIVAQRNTRPWIRTENVKMIDPPVTEETKARIRSIALPHLLFREELDLYLGSRHLSVRYYAGHTGGDAIVYLPDSHLVFCGDLLWKDHIPNLIDSTTQEWIKTLDALPKDLGTNTWIPGHGGVATAEDIVTLRKYMANLRAKVAKARAGRKSGDALVQAVLPSLKETYGKWAFFDLAAPGILQTAEELAGTKRLPMREQ